jgi:alpha-galactosidase
VADKAGDAHAYTISYTTGGGMPAVDQTFFMFADRDYFLTEVTLKSDSKIKSNYIAPVYTTEHNLFLPADNSNRFLTVPFDNDGFVTYGSHTLGCTAQDKAAIGRIPRDSISFEVTSIFNGNTRKGLVVGSVEHDNWKSAVRVTGSPMTQSYISRLECFSGVTHAATRDE